MTLGHFSFGFLAAPSKLSTIDFLGVCFLIVIVMIAWAHHVNDIT
jgi:hypothetical protein